MHIYHQIFSKDPYIRVSPLYNIISVFDSAQYDRVDQHLLTTEQRDYVLKKLVATDHDQKSNDILVHNSNGQFVRIVKNTDTGTSPLDPLESAYNHDDIFVVAPGSYFLFLLKKHQQYKKEDIQQELKDHISHQPVNLELLADFTKNESFYNHFRDHLDEFRMIQNAAQDTRLTNIRPLGKIL